jgi:sulfur carrier protein ThiS
MITFIKPKNLNGEELLAELNAAGVKITKSPNLDGEGVMWLDIEAKDEDKAKSVVAAHNGNMIPKEQTIDEKLASVGLSIVDLKAALGL